MKRVMLIRRFDYCKTFHEPCDTGHHTWYVIFLGAFAKLRKATIKLRHVCPSTFGSHRTDFHEILCLRIFAKICRENSSFIKIEQE